MLNRLVNHIRHNIVGYLALFVALGGTGYAAVNLPAGSIGASQIRNHAIAPVKFNHQFINGTVRAWAVVAPNGTVQSSAGSAHVSLSKLTQGSYVVTWKRVAVPTQTGCFAVSGLTGTTGPGSSGALLSAESKRTWRVSVVTYGLQGQYLAQNFYVAVVC